MIALARLPRSTGAAAKHIAIQSLTVREHSAIRGVDHEARALMERAAGQLADAAVLLQRASVLLTSMDDEP